MELFDFLIFKNFNLLFLVVVSVLLLYWIVFSFSYPCQNHKKFCLIGIEE